MVKTIPHPTLKQVRLGCNRSANPPKLRFRDYLRVAAGKLPGTPLNIDFSPEAAAALAQMYLNDTEGDCVPAGNAHLDGIWTGNATSGTPVVFTPAQINAMYTGMSGGTFNPSNPFTDQGCDPETALAWWQANGLLPDGSHKIAGWLGTDASNPVEIRASTWIFESTGLALELPDAWINPVPASSGFIWDVAGDPDPSNGHWVVAVGCSKIGLKICTWGMTGWITYPAIAKYCVPSAGGMIYTMVSQDAIVKAMNKAPMGLEWGQIVADFNLIGGNAA